MQLGVTLCWSLGSDLTLSSMRCGHGGGIIYSDKEWMTIVVIVNINRDWPVVHKTIFTGAEYCIVASPLFSSPGFL